MLRCPGCAGDVKRAIDAARTALGERLASMGAEPRCLAAPPISGVGAYGPEPARTEHEFGRARSQHAA